ncbi:MAG: ParB/RepB/Spo0J family partition protein [Spirochaetota bacterium]|nr:ParB/RepB/Spo0J family partition protein [Spirochaetota bacterium]
MFNWHSYNLKKIPISYIDLENNYFKLSRNNIAEIRNSISTFGLLTTPVLLNKQSKYIIVFGHNRINALKDLQNEYTDSIILDDIPSTLYIKNVMLKIFRNEIGPIGRVKLYLIMKNYFNYNKEDLLKLAKDINIPEKIAKTEILEKIFSLPDILKDYIDIKNIGFKTIKNLLTLPDDGISLLVQWLKIIDMRVNIFKIIVDYTIDIYKRDQTLKKIKDIDLDLFHDKKEKENFLYNQIKTIRFPQFIELRNKAGIIIKKLNKSGIEVDFPEYFEGNEIYIKYKIKKNEGIDSLRKRINEVDTTALENLLKLV